MSFRTKFLAIAATVALLGGASGAANAVVISSGSNNPYSFTWSFTTTDSGGTVHVLDGTGSMTVTGFGTSSLSIQVTLTNNADLGGNGGERLTSFGFGIDPDAFGVTFSDPGDSTGMTAATMKSIPSLKAVEVCAWGGQNCSGGSNGGIYGAGGTDTFTLILTTGADGTGTWGNEVTIEPIGFKYQTGYGSFEFTTTTSSTTTTGTPSTSSTSGVPEPNSSSLALLGLAMLGTAFGMRRRKLNS